MRVVVIGASGNVGTAVLERLRKRPEIDQLIAVGRHPPDTSRQDPNVTWPNVTWPNVTWKACDISRDALDPIVAGADAVVHLAWRFHPTRDVRQTWHTNVIGSMRLFDTCTRQQVPALVYASSVGAYSPRPATLGEPERAVDESWPTHALPTAAYGRQKSYVERVLDAVEATVPMRIVRIRSAFVFQRAAAPEQRRIFAGPFVPSRLLASRVLPVLPMPRGLRMQVVGADDLAAAYEAAVLHPVRGAFNIAARPVLRAEDIGELMDARIVPVSPALARRALSVAYRMRLVPAEPGLLELFLSLPEMDTTRARVELGWRPEQDARDVVESLLEGLRNPRGGPTPRLAAGAGGPARIGEIVSGMGARE